MMLRYALIFALAGAPCLAAAQELPTGDSAAFREHMLGWSGPKPERPSLPVVETAQGDVARGAALPRLSSRFGQRRDPFRGGHRLHAGIDIPGALGTPVLAAASGEVRFAGRAGGYGNMIELDHDGALATRYGHLSAILVRPGEPVAQGQVIARMGSTGRSTGNHLHFEVREAGRATDPLPFLHGRERVPAAYLAPDIVPHRSDFARARDGGSSADAD